MTDPIQDPLGQLPETLRWALQRADGFIDLKMFRPAREILDGLPDPYGGVGPCRLLRLRLAMEEEDWPVARTLAADLKNELPGQPALWIQLAYATRRASTIAEAEAVLREALAAFPTDAMIPYNLSCYACRQGDLPRAREYLRQSIARKPGFREIALEDEDLEPLWGEIEDL